MPNQMNYKELIEFGYLTERDNLKEYFMRDIMEHGYSFYWGCVDAISKWNNNAIDKSELKFILDQLDEALRGIEIGRPVFAPDVVENYIVVLSQYFEPKFKLEAFILGNQFKPPINFRGNQQQLAGVFQQLKANKDITYPAYTEKAGIYIRNNFTCNWKRPHSIIRYLMKKKIEKRNLLYISI
jgi:hypothetical protein